MSTSSQPGRAKKRVRDNTDPDNVQVRAHAPKKPKTTPSGSEMKEKGANDPLEGNTASQGKEKDVMSPNASDSVPTKSNKNARDKARKAKGTAIDVASSTGNTPQAKPSHKIRKLAPPRPFPTVPTSVSATGPKSQHKEGKNRICITRRTALGAYLRRCKELIMKDGFRELHLYALGAAIPHLARLAVSLPTVLPFASDEIHSEVKTGTAELHDELIPDDEDEDISMRTRGKSTMSVVVLIRDGDHKLQSAVTKMEHSKSLDKRKKKRAGKVAANVASSDMEEIVFEEGDQESDTNI